MRALCLFCCSISLRNKIVAY